MRTLIVNKSLSIKELKKIGDGNDFINFILKTGLRRKEVLRAIKQWDGERDYVDILTKKGGDILDRIWLLPETKKILARLQARNISSVQTIYQSISRYTLSKLGYNLSPHNFRSTFASRLIDNGVDLVTVSHLLHHSDISQTAKYIVISENRQEESIRNIRNE